VTKISSLPVRVLQLLDSDLDFQSQRVADDLLRGGGGDWQVERRVVGPSGEDRGVVSAFFRLKGRRDFDVVHTFGCRSLLSAALASKTPLVHSASAETRASEIRWMRAISGHRDIYVVSGSDTGLRKLVRSGVTGENTSHISPSVDFSRMKTRRDAELRAALGYVENDFVILAAGESTRHSRHELALWTCGILSESNENYRLLVWGRGQQAQRLVNRSRPWRLPGMARFAEMILGRKVEYEELLSAADLVLVTAENGAAILPMAISMAAGLPIVSIVNRTTSELLEDRHTAAMVGIARPRDLARRVLDVRNDVQLQWHITSQARAEAYENFSLSKSMEKWREIYSRALGKITV
jgi:glycosyltransferase involved in cell wall biosynthesis